MYALGVDPQLLLSTRHNTENRKPQRPHHTTSAPSTAPSSAPSSSTDNNNNNNNHDDDNNKHHSHHVNANANANGVHFDHMDLVWYRSTHELELLERHGLRTNHFRMIHCFGIGHPVTSRPRPRPRDEKGDNDDDDGGNECGNGNGDGDDDDDTDDDDDDDDDDISRPSMATLADKVFLSCPAISCHNTIHHVVSYSYHILSYPSISRPLPSMATLADKVWKTADNQPLQS